jgi:hypothetical protein
MMLHRTAIVNSDVWVNAEQINDGLCLMACERLWFGC